MAQVHLRGVKKTYDNKIEVIHGIDMEIADGEFIVIVGPVGLRQVHLAAHGGRAGAHHRRRGGDRRPRGQRARAQGPRHRHGVPELRALSAHERVPEHGLWAEDQEDAQGRDRAPGAEGGQDPRTGERSCSACRASCRAASASASPWAVPSCASPRCSCSTSRFPTSMPSCACRCGSRSSACSASSASPRSTSRTTRSRP